MLKEYSQHNRNYLQVIRLLRRQQHVHSQIQARAWRSKNFASDQYHVLSFLT